MDAWLVKKGFAMLYIFILSIICLFSNLYSMDTHNQSELPAYDIPYDPDSDKYPGESIHIEQDINQFKAGEDVSPYRILKIPFQYQPSMILEEWKNKYAKLDNFTEPEKNLILLAAQRLTLPIPPEPRDTSNTPNFDAFMEKRRQSYLRHRPAYAQVAVEVEEDDWKCTLL